MGNEVFSQIDMLKKGKHQTIATVIAYVHIRFSSCAFAFQFLVYMVDLKITCMRNQSIIYMVNQPRNVLTHMTFMILKLTVIWIISK